MIGTRRLSLYGDQGEARTRALRREDGRERSFVSTKQLGIILGVSHSTIHRMLRMGQLGPEPLRNGSRLRWDVAEIRRWQAAGEPDRKTWRRMQKEGPDGGLD